MSREQLEAWAEQCHAVCSPDTCIDRRAALTVLGLLGTLEATQRKLDEVRKDCRDAERELWAQRSSH